MNISSNTKKKDSIKLSFSLILGGAIALFNAESVKALSITFDYSYDTNGFFSGADGTTRKATLEYAGQYFTDYLSDTLSAITSDTGSTTGIGYEWAPGFTNSWTASFTNPATGGTAEKTDLTLLENQIIIYAGGRDIDALGIGGTGGSSPNTIKSGDNVVNQDFVDLIKGRGQSGALDDPATDIGLWGGSITFDTSINSGANNWHNDISETGLDTNEYDFLSTAVHELGHVFGFGGDSWDRYVNGTDFEGPNSIAAYNLANDPDVSAVPLESSSDTAHWKNGTEALLVTGDGTQEAALDPSIFNGKRKILTNLDYAGLADIGWQVDSAALNATVPVGVPFEFSPSLGILLTGSWFGLSAIVRRRKKNNCNLD